MPQTLSPSSHSGADVWGDELRGLAPGRETSHWPSGQHENFVSGAEKLTAIFKKALFGCYGNRGAKNNIKR